jgi:transposase
MPHIQGVQRDAVLLFPSSLDEYITPDNPVRVIDAFVDQLDLQALGFRRAVAASTGRPAYHPGDLLKLYIYGYLNRIRSSRLLERESHRNVELIWLLKKLTPDFKTIADFRKDNLQPLQKVCRAFTVLCKELELFGGELVAIDGSKFKAWNNRKRNWNDQKLGRALQEIDEKISSYLHDLDAQDRQHPNPPRLTASELQTRIDQLRARHEQYQILREQLAASGESQISLTDPDSRSMSIGQGVEVCYNVQVVTDAKHKLIVANDVTNDPTDSDQLAPMAIGAKEVLGVETLEATADMGYANGEQVKQCESAKIVAYVPKPHTSGRCTLIGDRATGLEKLSGSGDTLRCLGAEGGVSSIRKQYSAPTWIVPQGGNWAKGTSVPIVASASVIAAPSVDRRLVTVPRHPSFVAAPMR